MEIFRTREITPPNTETSSMSFSNVEKPIQSFDWQESLERQKMLRDAEKQARQKQQRPPQTVQNVPVASDPTPVLDVGRRVRSRMMGRVRGLADMGLHAQSGTRAGTSLKSLFRAGLRRRSF